jgi:hypothetical protein
MVDHVFPQSQQPRAAFYVVRVFRGSSFLRVPHASGVRLAILLALGGVPYRAVTRTPSVILSLGCEITI